MPRLRPASVLIPLLICAAFDGSARAQSTPPIVGVAFNTLLSSTEGLGVGVRARAAWPVNADMSVALGGGVTGFILEGRDQATYLVDPQVSVIVTMDPSRSGRTPYFMGGIGAAFPVNDRSNAESGPTIHFGGGWVQQLRDTKLFYEIDPALLVGETEISFLIPFRIGVIF